VLRKKNIDAKIVPLPEHLIPPATLARETAELYA